MDKSTTTEPRPEAAIGPNGPDLSVLDDERHRSPSTPPESITEAAAGKISGTGETEIDATEWLLSTELVGEEAEPEPTLCKLNIGTPEKRQIVEWWVRPLDGDSFKAFRQRAMGSNRSARRASPGAVVQEMDDQLYHLLVVTAATVTPDLRAAAKAKNVADPSLIVKHRFRHKPGLVTQISGVVSDISGYDEGDLEVAAGNS